MAIRYFDPRARSSRPDEPYTLAIDIAARPVRLGLIANSFPDATRFTDFVADMVTRAVPSVSVSRYTKPDTSPATANMRAAVAEECDAVVSAYGHQGSWTYGTVSDVINLARMGVPAVGLITERFSEEAAFVASSLGMTRAPWLELPYPIAGTGVESMQALASETAPRVIAALRGSA